MLLHNRYKNKLYISYNGWIGKANILLKWYTKLVKRTPSWDYYLFTFCNPVSKEMFSVIGFYLNYLLSTCNYCLLTNSAVFWIHQILEQHTFGATKYRALLKTALLKKSLSKSCYAISVLLENWALKENSCMSINSRIGQIKQALFEDLV